MYNVTQNNSQSTHMESVLVPLDKKKPLSDSVQQALFSHKLQDVEVLLAKIALF